MAQEREGDPPLVAIAGYGGRLLVQAHDAAEALDQIAPLEARRVTSQRVIPH